MRVSLNSLLAAFAAAGAVSAAATGGVQCKYIGLNEGYYNDPLNWSAGVVPWNGNMGQTYDVQIDSVPAVEVFLDMSASIDMLEVGAGNQLTFLDSFALRFDVGPIDNDGLILLQSTGSNTDLVLSTTQLTLSGAGVLELGGLPQNRIVSEGYDWLLVNGSNHTIRGGGTIGVDALDLDNAGLIEATADKQLWIDARSTGSTNTGIMQANLGMLNLQPATIDNTGGLIRALDASTVNLNGVTIVGGELTTVGDGVIRANANEVHLQDLLNTGMIEVANDIDPRVHGTITNDGTIALAAVNAHTDIVLGSSPVTLAGTGDVLMGTSSLNRIHGNGYDWLLVNGSDHTIHGAGNIGADVIDLDNKGLVSADDPALQMVVDLRGDGSLNTGTMQAVDGGVLRFENLSIDNTGGVIRAMDASFIDLVAPTITGGELTSFNTGELRVVGNTTIFADLLNTGSIRVMNDYDPRITGTIVNEGTIRLDSTGAHTDLLVGSPVATVEGGGQIVMGHDGPNRVSATGIDWLLVHAEDHTIRGAGDIGAYVIDLDNAGLVTADDPLGTLVVNLRADGSSNTGIMQAESGGTLGFASPQIDNTDGVIRALDGSFVDFSSPLIFGGELTTEGTGELRVVWNTTTLRDLLNTGFIRVLNDFDPRIEGVIVNDGTFMLDSSGAATDMLVGSETLTFTGDGQIVLGADGTNRISGIGYDWMLVNDVDHTIRGKGDLGTYVIDLTNDGLVTADVPGAALAVNLRGPGSFNTGIMQAESGGSLNFISPSIDNTDGVIRALDGSYVDFTGPLVFGGELTTEGSGELRVVWNTTILRDLLHTGFLRVLNDYDPRLEGVIVNDGTILLDSTGSATDLLVGTNPLTLAGTGELILGDAGPNRVSGVGFDWKLINMADHTIRGGGNIGVNVITIRNEGTIVADAAMTIDDRQTFTNLGLVHVTGPGSLYMAHSGMDQQGQVTIDEGNVLTRNGDYVQNAGFTTVQGELVITSGTLHLAGGLLEGTGLVTGAVMNNGLGSVNPATSTGILTVAGTYTQSGDGALVIEIDGFGAGTGYDVLAVEGTANLGGVLVPMIGEGFDPAPGSQFTILTADAINGAFTVVDTCDAFFLEYTDSEVILTILSESVIGDLNCDGFVDGVDLGLLLGDWGDVDSVADLNVDGIVNGADLGILLANWST